MKKRRLDEILIADGTVQNKQEAFIIVTEGRVFCDGQKAVSPAQLVPKGASITIQGTDAYVGRGALKLAAALDAFGVNPAGKTCIDIGAATGGFTEVLLRRGAVKVYAIDTARGKLDLKIRHDRRVVVMEGCDVRDVKALPGQADPIRSQTLKASADAQAHRTSNGADLAVIDVSLISLRDILGSARRLIKQDGAVVALFKPQYETRDVSLLHHGVIRDPAARRKLADDFAAWAGQNGWDVKEMIESPIRGDKGNAEYLFYLSPIV